MVVAEESFSVPLTPHRHQAQAQLQVLHNQCQPHPQINTCRKTQDESRLYLYLRCWEMEEESRQDDS